MKDSKLEERKTNFQKSAREDYKLSLRKRNIDDFILRKREKTAQRALERSHLEISIEQLTLPSEIINKSIQTVQEFIDFTHFLLTAKERDFVKFGILLARKYLSMEVNPPVIESVNAGFLEIMMNLLDTNIDDHSMAYEILWCFTNITANTSDKDITNFFLTHKSYRIFDKLLHSGVNDIISNVLWVLCHIVGDNEHGRDGIANSSLFIIVLDILEAETIDESVLKNALWFLNNLNKMTPNISNMMIVERLARILIFYAKSNRPDLIVDAIWSLANLCNEKYKFLYDIILESGVVQIVIGPQMEKEKLCEPYFRMIGNLLTGNSSGVDKLISIGVIGYLTKNLKCKFKTIRRESAWALSNIAAGTVNQIKELVHYPDCIPYLLDLFRENDLDIVREGVWTMSNALSGCDIETVIQLLNLHVMDAIVYILCVIQEPSVLCVALEGLKSFFAHGEILRVQNENFIVQQFPVEGMDALDKLQSHSHNDVFNIANEIMKNFFKTVPA